MRTTFTLLFSISLSLNAFSQTRTDIGLKSSTLLRDLTQLETRFFFHPKYAITLNLAYGHARIHQQNDYPTGDSTYINLSNIQEIQNIHFNVGIIRTFPVFKHEFYYASASIGVGNDNLRETDTETLYKLAEDQQPLTSPEPYYNYIISSFTSSVKNAPFFRFDFALGMDVPLSDDLSINWSLNAAFLHSELEPTTSSLFKWRSSISGGLRYRFGNPIE